MKARGDAIEVPMFHNGVRIGTMWRRPFRIFLGGKPRDMVRFNYCMFALEQGRGGEVIKVDEGNYKDFCKKPRRFNVVDINLPEEVMKKLARKKKVKR